MVSYVAECLPGRPGNCGEDYVVAYASLIAAHIRAPLVALGLMVGGVILGQRCEDSSKSIAIHIALASLRALVGSRSNGC